MIFTVLLCAASACCSVITLTGLAAMRAARSWGDPGEWDGPLLFASLSLALAAAAGLLPPLPGAVLAAVPLIALVSTLAPYWGSAVKIEGSHGKAALRLLAAAGRRALDLARAAPGILGGLRRGAPAGGPQAAAAEPVIARPRRTPSTARPDLLLGPALVPEQVAAELEAARVAVPACWAAVAEWEASFEPENGEDWRQHIAERAAGILTVAEVAGGQAEDLGTSVKLDPAVITAETDFADDFADTASAAVRSIQVYDSVYDGAHEHVENGGTLPEDARGWFGADGRDGRAA